MTATTSMKKTDDYAHESVEETLRGLHTDADRGLSSEEVHDRIVRYGYNEIAEKEEPLWHRLFRRFWGPIPWMIETAAVLSAAVQRWVDFTIVVIMLVVNAGLDFFQEHRALNALRALKQRLAVRAIVLRDGAFATVPAREIVPGDIVKLRIGDIVPADIKLISGDYLLVDQSSLTGESLPVSKEVGEIVYANSIVRQGEMLGVAVETGTRTSFQTVASLVSRAELEERSHFQKMVIRIGDFLILITVFLVLIIVMVALFRHEKLLEIARFALVLTVSAIPVALPAVLSVTMAVGAMNLARRKAIVSRLVAIEELAGVDVFCSDKTGTLTQNRMQVAKPYIFDGHSEEELFLVAALASRLENQDPIELPIFHHIEEELQGVDWKSYTQVHFTPFDPIHKRTEAEVSKGGEHFVAIKGAPQVVLELAQLPADRAKEVSQTVDVLASKGYRTLAVARQEGDDVDLIGLIPLFDPPREDSRKVIEDMAGHGVTVKMITGDNIAIAREVGHLLGLDGKAMRGSDIRSGGTEELLALAGALARAIYHRMEPDVSPEDAARFAESVVDEVRENFDLSKLGKGFVQTHESDIIALIESADIIAEVVPEDKYRIVDLLQKGDHIVGMTGDGVNDAPALKQADCGVAVSNATDAARAAADIILTAPGLGVINEAIKLARVTFERMKSYTVFRVAETIRIILFMTLAIVVFNFFPVTALMIIILALLNDIPILAIAYDNTRIDPAPVRWNMPTVLTVSSTLGIAGVVSSFTLFFILVQAGFSDELIQSMFFAKLVIAGHGTIYNTRNEDWFWRKPYPSWLLFGATFSTRILGTLIAVYGLWITPIGWKYAAYMWAYALAWFVFNDGVKMATYKYLKHRGIYA